MRVKEKVQPVLVLDVVFRYAYNTSSSLLKILLWDEVHISAPVLNELLVFRLFLVEVLYSNRQKVNAFWQTRTWRCEFSMLSRRRPTCRDELSTQGCNLVPRVHISFGQQQEHGLWPLPRQEVPANHGLPALKQQWLSTVTKMDLHSDCA